MNRQAETPSHRPALKAGRTAGRARLSALLAVLLVAMLTASSILVPSGASAQSASQPIMVAYAVTSINFFPTWLAQEAGLFEKHGLNVRLTELVGAPAVQALVSGSLAFYDGGASSLAARDAGMPIKVIGQGGPNNFSVFAQRDIETMDELRGKVVAIVAPGTSEEYVLVQLLEHFGLTPDDIRLTFTETPPASYASLLAGHAAAAVFAPPTSIQAADAGFNLLADIVELGLPGAGNYLIVNEHWAANNRETVLAFLKAYSEAVWMVQNLPPEEAAELLGRFYGIEDRELMRRTAEQFIPRYFAIPRVQEESIAVMIPAMGLKAEPSSYYDPSYVDELEQQGFYASLGIR